MGLTLIRKRSGPAPKHPRIALVLAGGAVSGGAFKVGGLKALNDYLRRRGISDLDLYVGLSAGSVLAVPLAAGIGPDEMVRVLEGTSERFDQLGPLDFYHPNFADVTRPAHFAYDWLTYGPAVAREVLRALPELRSALSEPWRKLLRKPDYTRFERFALALRDHVAPDRPAPSLGAALPAGVFDSVGLEKWMRRNLEKIGMPNEFRRFERKTGRSLYLCACNLDTAERTVFETRNPHDSTISQAVQASTALPGFYRPARIGGIDYVDGGVRNTANIDVAIENGADLVICYNPFRPFYNPVADPDSDEAQADPFSRRGHLADRGLPVVVNQVFRTLLQSRLSLGLARYINDDSFKGDIVLLEPTESDANFFAVNPLAFWKRTEALRHGYESVRSTIERNFDDLEEVFGAYGLEMDREAAAAHASHVLAERGWGDDIPDPPEDEPRLRVVAS